MPIIATKLSPQKQVAKWNYEQVLSLGYVRCQKGLLKAWKSRLLYSSCTVKLHTQHYLARSATKQWSPASSTNTERMSHCIGGPWVMNSPTLFFRCKWTAKVYYISELKTMISSNGLAHFLQRWCTKVHHGLFKLDFPSSIWSRKVFHYRSNSHCEKLHGGFTERIINWLDLLVIKHFVAQAYSFDKAFVGAVRLSKGSFPTLMIV